MFKIQTVLIVGALAVSSIASADVNTGLVAHYSFDNCKATDASGNGHDGVIIGTPTCSAGKSGKALTFDGSVSKNYIEVPDSDQLDFTDTYSFSLWINQKSKAKRSYRLLEKATPGLPNGYGLDTYGCNDAGNVIRLLTSEPSGFTCATRAYSLKTYHHIAVIVSAGVATFYQDGIKNGSKNLSAFTKQNNLTLRIAGPHEGCGFACDTDEYFDGSIDDIRIYNRALTSDDIAELYNKVQPINGSAKGLQQISIICSNLTTGQSVTIPPQSGTDWNCKNAGLKTSPNQSVNISIDGNTYP